MRAVMNPNERNILTVTCFGHFMSHYNMLVFPALLLPLAGRLQMDLSHVLALSTPMYLLFGVTALPWGLLTDRLGAKPTLFLFYAGAGVCGLAAALNLDSPSVFALCLAGVGLFSGIYHPAGLGLISKGITRMSMALGYNGMAGNLGLASAPLLTGAINQLFGMRAAYLFLGGLNLLGAVIMLVMPYSEPEKKPRGEESHHSKTLLTGFMVLCVAMGLGGIAYTASTVILPAYFEIRNQEFYETLRQVTWFTGSKNVVAAALTSLVLVVGIFGQYMGGWYAERFDPRKGYLLFHSIALPMVFFMAYTVDVPLLLVTTLYLLFLLGMQPMENTLVAVLTPDRLRHSAYGTKFILTFGVGALAVPMVAKIESAWTLPSVFIVLACVSACIVLTIVFLRVVTRSVTLRA